MINLEELEKILDDALENTSLKEWEDMACKMSEKDNIHVYPCIKCSSDNMEIYRENHKLGIKCNKCGCVIEVNDEWNIETYYFIKSIYADCLKEELNKI